ncbi:hypothetical protein [Hymenobacter latericus]|uniref:hypothetical protein n=1 Tax=Hymenobacter sp. YIM 151858-1 TaxID=2987688 RepID=UPI00222710A9|nr:hypothetical protein [Hymenobacter sp. YIM 151858-1]UYZ58336.1 hypothetical protein OIS50_14870 [Hymenobacter sp. YIM 151858-1]
MAHTYPAQLRLALVLAAFLGAATAATAQEAAAPNRKLGLQVHYGAGANFQAAGQRDTPEELNSVDLVGSAGGAELSYRVGKAGAVALGYTRTVNMQQKHISYSTGYAMPSSLDFRLRYINNAFQAVYERAFSADFKAHAGLLYLTTAKQSATVNGSLGSGMPLVLVSETNRSNSFAEEGGVVAGLEYSRPVDTRLRLGLKVRCYYLASVSTFEMLTLTPTLTYRL